MSDIARNYYYIKEQAELSQVQSWLGERRFFCIDTETDTLDPFNSNLILLQIGDKDRQWIIDCRAVNMQPLKPWIEDTKIIKLGQHIKHDIKMLMAHLGWKPRSVACTMIAEQVLRCGIFARASMETLCNRYLHIQIDKDETLRKSFGSTGVGEFSERQLTYASGDVIYPQIIAQKQKELIGLRGLKATLDLEMQVIPVLASMEMAGMGIDTSAWNALYQEAMIKKHNAEKLLNKLFGVHSLVQGGLFGEDSIINAIDYNSSKQVRRALDRLGYVLEGTDKEDIALAAITGVMPRELAQAILTFRRAFTRTTRYGHDFLAAIQKTTGRIHTDFTQCNTSTGRLSSGEDEDSDSDKVNLQNIPRASEYRSCFVPRPGYVFIIYDYQAIEPRILGEMSLDPTYLHAFDHGLDIYSVVGSKMLGEEVSKRKGRPYELREKTKITVLGNSYGTGKDKFHRKMLIDMNLIAGVLNEKILDISREESDMLHGKFFEICPKIKHTLDELSTLADPTKSARKFYDEVVAFEEQDEVIAKIMSTYERISTFSRGKDTIKNLIKNRAYVTYSESMGGRKRLFKVYNRKFWTEGRNQPIQGTAADVIKRGMVAVHNHIEDKKYDAFIVNQVHDELITEVREDQAEQLDPEIKNILEGSESYYLKRVPSKVEGGIFKKWQK